MRKVQGNAVLFFLMLIIAVFSIIQTRIEIAREVASNSVQDNALFISEETRKNSSSLQHLVNNMESYYDRNYKKLHIETNSDNIYMFYDFEDRIYRYFTINDENEIFTYNLSQIINKFESASNLETTATTNDFYNKLHYFVATVNLKNFKQKILISSDKGRFKNFSPVFVVSKTKSFDTGYGSYVPVFNLSLLVPQNDESNGIIFSEQKVGVNSVVNKKITSVLDGLDKVSNYISSKQKYLITSSPFVENSLAVKGSVYLYKSDTEDNYNFTIADTLSTGNCPNGQSSTCTHFYGINSAGTLMLNYDDLWKALETSGAETVHISATSNLEYDLTEFWNGPNHSSTLSEINNNSKFLFSALDKIRNTDQDSYFVPSLDLKTSSTSTLDYVKDNFHKDNLNGNINFCGLNSYCGFKLEYDRDSQMIKEVDNITTANALLSLYPDLLNDQVLLECGGSTMYGDNRTFLAGIENPFAAIAQSASATNPCPDKVSNLLVDNSSPFVFGDNLAYKNQNIMIYALGVNNELSCPEYVGTAQEQDLCQNFPVIYKKYYIIKGQ